MKKEIKEESPKEWEKEFDNFWEYQVKFGRGEMKNIFKDFTRQLISQEKQKWVEEIEKMKVVESDFLDWHSKMPITTENRKQARIWRNIYNLALETLKQRIKK